jgi:hypothetical protein
VSDGDGRVLLLVGSPKGLEKSNSARFGRMVVDRLERRGWTSEVVHLHAAVRTEEGRQALLDAIDRASVVLFAAPLYVDSLPAPAIRALEAIAARRRAGSVSRVPRLVTLINCGFVEPSQNDTCQRILHRFAERAGFEWLAGISLGGGGRVPKRVREAFDILAESLDLEILVPDEVERLTRKPIMPSWLYVVGGNFMWRRWAARNGAKERLRDRPYERVDS